jgi:glycosyltransferase involved in cell wall biosynthesis
MMNPHFKIIIPLYNAAAWIELCLTSVKDQTHENFQCIIVDDVSTDESAPIIKRVIQGDPRFVFLQNNEKKLALHNIYTAINTSNPADDDIIVTLDGDDWLATPDVLSRLVEAYRVHNCWITYGSYREYPSGFTGPFCQPIAPRVISQNLHRQSPWYSSHLRTFKYGLWGKIKKNDLLDSEGGFYPMAWDQAFMLPMLEMAAEKSLFIPDILYIYNLNNPLNDHKTNHSLQLRLEREIRNKNPYPKLNHLSADDVLL